MRKFYYLLLAVAASVCCAFGISACNLDGGNTDGDKTDTDAQSEWGTVYTRAAAYKKAVELGYTGTLDEFISSISGKDGSDGLGIKDVTINSSGYLVVTLTDNSTVTAGKVTLTKCEHSYSAWSEGKAATCTSIGYNVRECSLCGVTDYEFTDELGHDYKTAIVEEATCVKEGHVLYVCETCGAVKMDITEISAEHNFEGGVCTECDTVDEENYITLTYNFNYEGASKDTVLVIRRGSTIRYTPTLPYREGCEFIGWALEKDSQEIVSPDSVSTDKNVTLYAVWQEYLREYVIIYDVGDVGAQRVDRRTCVGGESFRLPYTSAPGYTFNGWEDSDGERYSAYVNYKPSGNERNIVLHAVWQEHSYNVVFVIQPEIFNAGKYGYGDKITKPENDPERAGYEFAGWFTAETGGEAVDFETYTVPALDYDGATLYVYAHWTSDGVVTTIFDAEFVHIDPNHQSPGYSGSTTTGYGIILPDGDGFGATTQHQEGSPYESQQFYVTYMYEPNFTLTFNINSSAATDATLVLRAAVEKVFDWYGSNESNRTFTSAEGDMCIKMFINSVELDYGSFTVEPDSFKDFELGTIHLNEGENVIKFVVSNNTSYGGTAKAAAPIVDCIKINGADSVLSWNPEYDNLANR